ncbi:hypothetical protein AB0I28_38630 [Phytomonospora sp. NPDC050363]|uniref:hypothetical protein n=1 Tax=Phytomonospora sp. NPDC050363 TaxID=3155642 RepID=UPI0033D2DA0F
MRIVGKLAVLTTAAMVGIVGGVAGVAAAGGGDGGRILVAPYRVANDGGEFRTEDGAEGAHRTDPMAGDLRMAAERFEVDLGGTDPTRLEMTTAPVVDGAAGVGDGVGDGLGVVTIVGDGRAEIEQESILPPVWRIVISVDLVVTVEHPPAEWGDGGADGGPVVFTSAEPLRLTATIGSLTIEEFTLGVEGPVRLVGPSGDVGTGGGDGDVGDGTDVGVSLALDAIVSTRV